VIAQRLLQRAEGVGTLRARHRVELGAFGLDLNAANALCAARDLAEYPTTRVVEVGGSQRSRAPNELLSVCTTGRTCASN
jgi:hypothetical protein